MNMYEFMYLYVCVCVNIYIYVYIHTYLHTYIHTYILTQLYETNYVHKVSMLVCKYVCVRSVRFLFVGSVSVGFNCENSGFGFFRFGFLTNNCFSFGQF